MPLGMSGRLKKVCADITRGFFFIASIVYAWVACYFEDRQSL